MTTAQLETAVKNFRNSLKIQNSAERPDKWLIETCRYRIAELGNEIKARKVTGLTGKNEPQTLVHRTDYPNTASENVNNTAANNFEDSQKANNLHSKGSTENESKVLMHGFDINPKSLKVEDSKMTKNMQCEDSKGQTLVPNSILVTKNKLTKTTILTPLVSGIFREKEVENKSTNIICSESVLTETTTVESEVGYLKDSSLETQNRVHGKNFESIMLGFKKVCKMSHKKFLNSSGGLGVRLRTKIVFYESSLNGRNSPKCEFFQTQSDNFELGKLDWDHGGLIKGFKNKSSFEMKMELSSTGGGDPNHPPEVYPDMGSRMKDSKKFQIIHCSVLCICSIFNDMLDFLLYESYHMLHLQCKYFSDAAGLMVVKFSMLTLELILMITKLIAFVCRHKKYLHFCYYRS